MSKKSDYRDEMPIFLDGMEIGHTVPNGSDFSIRINNSKGLEILFNVFNWLSQSNNGLTFDVDSKRWLTNTQPENGRQTFFSKIADVPVTFYLKFFYEYGEDLQGSLSIGQKKVDRDCLNDLIKTYMSGKYAHPDALNFNTSLAGGEPKAAFHIVNVNGKKEFYRPSVAFPSTHILKISKFLSPVEAISMAFAKKCDFFPVVPTEFIAIAGKPAVLVQRYDRFYDDNGLHRIWQEDFCQLLNHIASEKYKIRHEDMARIMVERISEKERLDYIRMFIFNMAIGNPDDHAKNFSLCCDPVGNWTFAPGYDMISIATIKHMCKDAKYNKIHYIYGVPEFLRRSDLRHTRTFGKERDPYKIKRKDVKLMAEMFHIQENDILESMQEIPKKILSLIEDFSIHLPDLSEDDEQYTRYAMKKFQQVVGKRAKSLMDVFERAQDSEQAMMAPTM